MICCTDVAYSKEKAQACGVLYENWTDSESYKTYISESQTVQDYVSGSFFERELPCLMGLIGSIKEPLDYLLVDGFVWLGQESPGLGHYLYEALDGQIPIIGVAKRSFKDNDLALPVLRGTSQRPLWITAVGCEPSQAALWLASMHGDYRLPTLLKLADRLGRERLES